jgi:SAM-dependent methyltransferase
VLAANALHWFDRSGFYAEVRRILRPGGVLAAIGYGWFYVDPVVDEIVGRALLKPLEPVWAGANLLLLDGYRTIDFPGEEIRLTPCAIHLAWTRDQLEDYVKSWSAVQRAGPGLADAAFAELATVWSAGEQRHIYMPVIGRAARL